MEVGVSIQGSASYYMGAWMLRILLRGYQRSQSSLKDSKTPQRMYPKMNYARCWSRLASGLGQSFGGFGFEDCGSRVWLLLLGGKVVVSRFNSKVVLPATRLAKFGLQLRWQRFRV